MTDNLIRGGKENEKENKKRRRHPGRKSGKREKMIDTEVSLTEELKQRERETNQGKIRQRDKIGKGREK